MIGFNIDQYPYINILMPFLYCVLPYYSHFLYMQNMSLYAWHSERGMFDINYYHGAKFYADMMEMCVKGSVVQGARTLEAWNLHKVLGKFITLDDVHEEIHNNRVRERARCQLITDKLRLTSLDEYGEWAPFFKTVKLRPLVTRRFMLSLRYRYPMCATDVYHNGIANSLRAVRNQLCAPEVEMRLAWLRDFISRSRTPNPWKNCLDDLYADAHKEYVTVDTLRSNSIALKAYERAVEGECISYMSDAHFSFRDATTS